MESYCFYATASVQFRIVLIKHICFTVGFGRSKTQWPHPAQVVLGAVLGSCGAVVQAAISATRRRLQCEALMRVKASRRLSAPLSGHLAGKQGYLNTVLYAKVGRVAVRQLHHRHHHKDCGYLPPDLPLDGITRELEAALDHLIAISDWARPRTITLEDSTAGYVTFGW